MRLAVVIALLAGSAFAADIGAAELIDFAMPVYGSACEWRFLGESSDHSGNGRHLTPNGKATIEAGYASIAGPTGFLTTADFEYPTNSFSVFAWVKTTDMTNKCIVAHYNNAAGNYRAWYMSIAPGGWSSGAYKDKFGVTLSADGGATAIKAYASKTVVADGKWHHVGFVFSENSLILYVDGKKETNPYKQADRTVNAVYDCQYDVSVGCFNTASGGNDGAGITGKIAHAVLFPRTLADEEVMRLYLQGEPE